MVINDCTLVPCSFQFTAKSLQRQAKKANKDEAAEKNKLKLVSRVKGSRQRHS